MLRCTRSPILCRECGAPMLIDESGVSYHVSEDTPDGVDHDADADHVAVSEDEDATP